MHTCTLVIHFKLRQSQEFHPGIALSGEARFFAHVTVHCEVLLVSMKVEPQIMSQGVHCNHASKA